MSLETGEEIHAMQWKPLPPITSTQDLIIKVEQIAEGMPTVHNGSLLFELFAPRLRVYYDSEDDSNYTDPETTETLSADSYDSNDYTSDALDAPIATFHTDTPPQGEISSLSATNSNSNSSSDSDVLALSTDKMSEPQPHPHSDFEHELDDSKYDTDEEQDDATTNPNDTNDKNSDNESETPLHNSENEHENENSNDEENEQTFDEDLPSQEERRAEERSAEERSAEEDNKPRRSSRNTTRHDYKQMHNAGLSFLNVDNPEEIDRTKISRAVMGIVMNPYEDLCVANRTIKNEKQCTVAFYVDDLFACHAKTERPTRG